MVLMAFTLLEFIGIASKQSLMKSIPRVRLEIGLVSGELGDFGPLRLIGTVVNSNSLQSYLAFQCCMPSLHVIKHQHKAMKMTKNLRKDYCI